MKLQKYPELKRFFIYELNNTYGMEKYLATEFPMMIKAAYTSEVIMALNSQQTITHKQIIRLEAVFDNLSLRPHANNPEVMEKMIKECKILIRRTKHHVGIREASLLMTGREICYYGIAAYAGLVRLSSSLKLNKVSQSLYMAMEDKMDADTNLRDVTDSYFYSITNSLNAIS